MKYLFALVCFVVAGSCLAASCRVVRVQAVHHAPVVHHAAAVLAVQYVPAYSIGYSDPAILEELKALRAKVEALSAPVALPVRAAHPGLATMQAKCATCHDETNKAKGGGHVLFKGGVFLEDKLEAAVSMITPDPKGVVRMPPGKKLDAGESFDVLRYLVVKDGK